MVENTSKKISLHEAYELNLKPCKFCHPPTSNTLHYSNSNRSHGVQNQSVQCRGIIRSGRRCRHKTRIGNGYCYQHQPR